MSGAWRPILVGYAVQLTNMVVLFLYHFLLPVVLDTAAFAQLVVVAATGGLIVLLFDAGFNLMTVRRPSKATVYLGYKLRLALVCSCVALVLLVADGAPILGVVSSMAYAIAFTLYTHGSALLVGRGHFIRAAYVTCSYGLLLTAVPILMNWLGLPLSFAPLLSTAVAVLSLEMALPGWVLEVRRVARSLFSMPRIRHIGRSFARQMQLSAGPFIEGMTTSGAILYCALRLDATTVASVRVAFSMAAVMGMVLPFNRQYVFAAFASERGVRKIASVAAWISVVAVVQSLALYGAGRFGFLGYYAPAEKAFETFPWVLLAVPGVRVLFELSVVAADRMRVIGSLMMVYATVPVAVLALAMTQNVEIFALTAYALALGVGLFLMTRAAIRRPQQFRGEE